MVAGGHGLWSLIIGGETLVHLTVVMTDTDSKPLAQFATTMSQQGCCVESTPAATDGLRACHCTVTVAFSWVKKGSPIGASCGWIHSDLDCNRRPNEQGHKVDREVAC